MSETDKFIAMVSAKVDVDLRLGDFQPRSMLVAQAHSVFRAKFARLTSTTTSTRRIPPMFCASWMNAELKELSTSP